MSFTHEAHITRVLFTCFVCNTLILSIPVNVYASYMAWAWWNDDERAEIEPSLTYNRSLAIAFIIMSITSGIQFFYSAFVFAMLFTNKKTDRCANVTYTSVCLFTLLSLLVIPMVVMIVVHKMEMLAIWCMIWVLLDFIFGCFIIAFLNKLSKLRLDIERPDYPQMFNNPDQGLVIDTME